MKRIDLPLRSANPEMRIERSREKGLVSLLREVLIENQIVILKQALCDHQILRLVSIWTNARLRLKGDKGVSPEEHREQQHLGRLNAREANRKHDRGEDKSAQRRAGEEKKRREGRSQSRQKDTPPRYQKAGQASQSASPNERSNAQGDTKRQDGRNAEQNPLWTGRGTRARDHHQHDDGQGRDQT